jgi:hypothetical protein
VIRLQKIGYEDGPVSIHGSKLAQAVAGLSLRPYSRVSVDSRHRNRDNSDIARRIEPAKKGLRVASHDVVP